MKHPLYLILFLSCFLSWPAYAYLDPGTGSIILQMAIAGLLSALFTIKMYWYRVKSFFKELLGRKKTNDTEDNDTPKDSK